MVARDNYVGKSTVERLVNRYRRTGDVVSVQDKHGPSHKLSDQEELIVLQLFLDKPGIYLREVQQELLDITGTWIAVQHYAELHSDLAYQGRRCEMSH